MMENIWYKDPKNFVGLENLTKIIPTKSMTYVQQLNAIMRFSIYFSLLIFLVKKNILAWYFALFIALITIFMYEFYARNNHIQNELYDKINVMYDEHKSQYCSRPSQNNPFMNVLMSEYASFPNRPDACDINNSKVRRQAEKFFDNNLYKDVDDIWSRKTSSRNWHTVPSSQIPNDRESFQKWLYGTGKTCKEKNGNACYTNVYHPYVL